MQSNRGLADSLARSLQGLKLQAYPSVRLSKFTGSPQKAGDPTLTEWLDEFERHCRQFSVADGEKASVLIDHLTGSAKEELMCYSAETRKSVKDVKQILRDRFSPLITYQSLKAAFYSRNQAEGENLADFSRALMKLYGKMESIAFALTSLKEGALKEWFVSGARDPSVKRELRRIEMSNKDKDFFVMRDEVLAFFKDQEPVSKKKLCEGSRGQGG